MTQDTGMRNDNQVYTPKMQFYIYIYIYIYICMYIYIYSLRSSRD